MHLSSLAPSPGWIPKKDLGWDPTPIIEHLVYLQFSMAVLESHHGHLIVTHPNMSWHLRLVRDYPSSHNHGSGSWVHHGPSNISFLSFFGWFFTSISTQMMCPSICESSLVFLGRSYYPLGMWCQCEASEEMCRNFLSLFHWPGGPSDRSRAMKKLVVLVI